MGSVGERLAWICGWRHSRGFGVQSSTDYGFIQDIINERLPYYAYDELYNKHSGITRIQRKKGELYLRLANRFQPATARIINAGDYCRDYISAGCRRTEILLEAGIGPVADMMIAHLDEDAFDEIYGYITRCSSPTSVVVVEDIHLWRNRGLWKVLRADGHVRIVYDLYYLAIMLFDPSRYRQYYKVNL